MRRHVARLVLAIARHQVLPGPALRRGTHRLHMKLSCICYTNRPWQHVQSTGLYSCDSGAQNVTLLQTHGRGHPTFTSC